MADTNGFRKIYCIVQGDNDVFKVKASVDNHVADLKLLVFEILNKDNKLRDISESSMFRRLWILSPIVVTETML
jgi:hypothetical protein